jgi:SHS2 domain-containing protein
MAPQFEILEHPADVGLRAYGATLEELFANAAMALLSIAGDLEAIEEREQREIEATGGDTESLLYAWLAEIVAVADADRLVLRRVECTALNQDRGAGRVTGIAYGERYDHDRHRSGTAIKAVTYHRFFVKQTPTGWLAEVFLDL